MNNDDLPEPHDASRRALLAAGAGLAALGALASPATAQDRAVHPVESLSGVRRFKDRVVLITGATSGIGQGVTAAFAGEGAKVMFCGRREALGGRVAAAINADQAVRSAGGEATYLPADVRREKDVAAFVDACVRKYGRIDIAHNNAGIAINVAKPIPDQPSGDFTDIMMTNAFGVFFSLKHELPVMVRNDPWGAFGTRGVVINTASTSGHVGYPNIAPYGASKAAILSLTRNAALEFGPQGIRVNSFSPGGVDTPMRRRAYTQQGVPESAPLPPVPNIPRRANTVAEMADVVLFLASDAGSSLYGVDLDVTGGNLTGPYFRQAPKG